MPKNIKKHKKHKKIYEQKIQQLEDLIENNKNAPAQGSAEWLRSRMESVGGSEMYYVVKKKNLRSLAESKLGIKEFVGNKYTRWGNLCEELTRMFAELTFHTNVYETGALPGCVPFHHYSPDGLGIVKKKYLKKYVSKEVYKTLPYYCFVLFEFKNPFSRVPNGIIPEDYQVQVQTGLNDIKHTDIGIFLDMVVRKCSLNQLDWTNEYDKKYYTDPSKMPTPVAIGFIAFVEDDFGDDDDLLVEDHELATSEDIGDHMNDQGLECESPEKSDNLKYNEYGYVDFGDTHYENFDIITEKVKSKKTTAYYTVPTPGVFHIYTELVKLDKFCEENEKKIIGFMPYKIFSVHIISMEKERNYLGKEHAKIIEDLVDFIRQHRESSKETKIKALDKKYPKYMKTAVVDDFLKQVV